MATTTPPIDRDELTRVIRTGDPIHAVGPMRAVALLSSGQVPDARDLLMDVVVDRGLQPRLRVAAVHGLYRSAGRAPGRLLTEMASHADEWTAAPIALALGRVGGENAEGMVARLEHLAPAHLRSQVSFARTLLSYRNGLATHPVRAPRPQQLQDPARADSAIGVAAATSQDTTAAVKALDADPIDVDLVAEGARRIDCQPNTFVWLWNRALAAPEHPGENTVAGVLTRQDRFGHGHSLSRIALLTPGRATTTLTIHRAASGEIEYAGSISPRGELTLRALRLPGLAAVAIEGRVSDHELDLGTALSATTVRAARAPAAG